MHQHHLEEYLANVVRDNVNLQDAHDKHLIKLLIYLAH